MLVNVDERPEAVGRISSFRPDVIRPQEAKRGAVFAIMVQSFASWRNRGTSFMATTIDSLCRSLVEGTGAVSRYNFDRSQKLLMIHKSGSVQMRGSGYKT